METMTVKEYDSLPVIYDSDANISRPILKVGDLFLLREPDEPKDVGDVVSVYRVIKVTDTGEESKIDVYKLI